MKESKYRKDLEEWAYAHFKPFDPNEWNRMIAQGMTIGEIMNECKDDQAKIILQWFDNHPNIVVGYDLLYYAMLLADMEGGNSSEIYEYVVNNFKYTQKAFDLGLREAYTNDVYGDCLWDYFYDAVCPMTKSEKKKYDSLPDKITIYRGTSVEEYEKEDWGASWTLNPKVAKFFAYRFGGQDRCVIKAVVDKSFCNALFTCRDEDEIINLNYTGKVELISQDIMDYDPTAVGEYKYNKVI